MDDVKIEIINLNLYYGNHHALKEITMDIRADAVTALIGPSGCGKSTFLKTLNRMNDLTRGVKITGQVRLEGEEIYAPGVDVTLLRKRVGMVFQQPNPFPMSIYDNIAYGPRVHGEKSKARLDEIVERSLRRAAIWEETRNRLKKSALGLSGGQQQRPRAGSGAGSFADGRTDFGAGSGLYTQNRGTAFTAEKKLYHRYRHPQHAAGRTGVGRYGLFSGGRGRRMGRHRSAFFRTAGQEDQRLYYGKIRLK